VKVIVCILFTSALLFSQAKPEFEVASIKPSSEAPEGRFNLGVHIDGAQVRVTYFSLKDFALMAYGMKNYQFAGPEWMTSARFDVSAKLPEGGSRTQVRAMLQTLLEARFQLKVHRSSKEMPVYALTVAKSGLKMKETEAADDATGLPGANGAVGVSVNAGRDGADVNLGNGSSIAFGETSFEGKKLTMAMLVDQLGRFSDRPVVDMTGLTGNYDLKLEFTAEEFRAMKIRAAVAAGVNLPPQALRLLENTSDAPLLTAIQTLGLRLESRKAPVEVLVIDNCLKAPTEN
jgi:uncharacterized protein (TIGR03435 family)